MAENYKVTLAQIADELNLETVYTPKGLENLYVHNNDINRPGLQLTGFYNYFDIEKIQICGNTEFAYITNFDFVSSLIVLVTIAATVSFIAFSSESVFETSCIL